MLIITTSNSPPSVAVDAVIFARAWSSGNDTNLRLIPVAFSNSGAREIASFICGLATIAMTSVLPPVPTEPAPAQPVTSRDVAAKRASSLRTATSREYLHLEARAAAHLGERLGVLLQRQRVREQRIGVDRTVRDEVERGAAAVQHGHRADEGDFVVVDAERRQRDAGLGARDAEDEQPAAAADRVEGGVDGGGGAGGVDGDVELLAVQVADVLRGGDGTETGCSREPGLVAVDHRDLRAGALQQLLHDQAHGAGADHEEALSGFDPDAAHAVHRAGDGLDQRTLLPGLRVGHAVAGGRRDGDVLGEGAVDGVAGGAPVRAEVAVAGAARAAVAAEQRRVDRDAVADLPLARHVRAELDDFPGELVPGDDGIRRGREVPVGDVQVGPADPARCDLDDDLAFSGFRLGHLAAPDLAGPVDAGGARALPLPRAHTSSVDLWRREHVKALQD